MIANPGYEVPASASSPGAAASWTTTTTSSLETTAEFTGDSALALSGYETFDHGWGTADPEVLLSELTDLLVLKLDVERFEKLWPKSLESDASFQGFFFLGALESSVFDSATQTVEDFENLWGSPIDLDMLLTDAEVAAATFGSDAVEGFEDSWGFAAFTLTSTSTASFDAGGLSTSTSSPSSAEKFTLKVRQRVQSDIAANKMTAVSPPLLLVAGDAVTFVAESGSLPEPLVEDTSYVVASISSNAVDLVSGAATVDLTVDGSGANYVLADPGRFWLDEL